jgi:hypothetical protein
LSLKFLIGVARRNRIANSTLAVGRPIGIVLFLTFSCLQDSGCRGGDALSRCGQSLSGLGRGFGGLTMSDLGTSLWIASSLLRCIGYADRRGL